jgi:hypothetical protein
MQVPEKDMFKIIKQLFSLNFCNMLKSEFQMKCLVTNLI